MYQIYTYGSLYIFHLTLNQVSKSEHDDPKSSFKTFFFKYSSVRGILWSRQTYSNSADIKVDLRIMFCLYVFY